MTFDDDDLNAFLDAFDARDYTVKLNGVAVKTVRGIYRRRTEFIGQSEQIVVLPSALIKETDLDDVTRQHTLTDSKTLKEYKIYGDFVPQESGFNLVGLVKK